MKHKLNAAMQLTSFIIIILGLIALAVLVRARLMEIISPISFLVFICIVIVTLKVDIWWLNRNFIEGEWIRKGGKQIEL